MSYRLKLSLYLLVATMISELAAYRMRSFPLWAILIFVAGVPLLVIAVGRVVLNRKEL